MLAFYQHPFHSSNVLWAWFLHLASSPLASGIAKDSKSFAGIQGQPPLTNLFERSTEDENI